MKHPVGWPAFITQLVGLLGLLALASPGQAQCTTEACQACRNAGYSNADGVCSFLVHRSRIEVRERFVYTGTTEGHDDAANLLQGCSGTRPTVCNVSRGTCTKCDTGCSFPLFFCQGARWEPACRPGQQCVGEWASSKVGPWSRYDRVSEVTVTSTSPTDCDCTWCPTGWRGSYTVRSYNGDFAGESKTSIAQCVSNAGCMAHKGWDGVHSVDRGYVCGFISDWVCVTYGVVIRDTISRSLRTGDPDFYIPPYCFCCE